MNSTCSECVPLAFTVNYGINIQSVKLNSLVSMALKILEHYPLTCNSSRKILLKSNFVLCAVQFILQLKFTI